MLMLFVSCLLYLYCDHRDLHVPTHAFPTRRSSDLPYVWQTVIWFDLESQGFSLVPSNNATPLDGFKTGIIAGYDGERIRPEVPVTRADAAVAFIALHMAHLTGWYAETRPLGPAGGSHFLSRSEEHTSELQSLMRISYAVFCLKKKKK